MSLKMYFIKLPTIKKSYQINFLNGLLLKLLIRKTAKIRLVLHLILSVGADRRVQK